MASVVRFLAGPILLLLLAGQPQAFSQPSADGQRILELEVEALLAYVRHEEVRLQDDCTECLVPLKAEADAKRAAAFQHLAGVIARTGWAYQAWGSNAEHAAFETLSSHMASLEDNSDGAAAVAKSVLPDLRSGILERGLSASGYALIADQVELLEGRPQIYGSQFACVGDQFAPVNVLEPERLNARRGEIGLEPIEEHRYATNPHLQAYCVGK